MGTDIFLHCLKEGEDAYFPRALCEEIFLRNALNPHLPLEALEYPDGRAEFYLEKEDEMICHMFFPHSYGPTFFAALYELVHKTRSVILWVGMGPTGPGFAVTDPDVAAELPPDWIPNLGQPLVVSSGEELETAIYYPEDWKPPPADQAPTQP
jgi:hypothetical protein